MKKIISIVFVFVVIISSCKKEDVLVEEKNQEKLNFSAVDITEADLSKIDFLVNEMKFSKENIKILDNYIIVDNDILFDRNNFWELYKQKSFDESTEKTHYKQNYLVTKISTISVVVTPGAVSWLSIVQSAASAWNSLNGRISFSVISSSTMTTTGINVVSAYVTNSPNVIAAGSFVTSNGYPGNNLIINKSFTGTLTSSEKKMAIVHELGHCIGFYHTDGFVGTPILGVPFTCQNNTDFGSVMRAYVTSWNGFSSCDQSAFHILY